MHDGLSLPVTLIYANRSENIAFADDLGAWAAAHPELIMYYVVGEPLSARKVAKLAPSLNASLVYLSGPEPMVESLGDELKAAGLPEAQLKQDFFPNYDTTNY